VVFAVRAVLPDDLRSIAISLALPVDLWDGTAKEAVRSDELEGFEVVCIAGGTIRVSLD
jgi:hypothetical protein